MTTPSLARSWRNFRLLGAREYLRQMIYISDPKAGKLMGVDEHGNRFYEDNSESFLRNRWVDFAAHDYNASQITPEWHSWISHIRKDVPDADPIIQSSRQEWQQAHVENLTGTRGAYKPYSTTPDKITAWKPQVAQR